MQSNPFLLVCAVWLISVAGVAGDSHSSHAITFNNGWVKEPTPGLMMTGGYVTIKNNTYANDQLIAAYSEIAEKVELHTMTIENEVMNMRQVQGGWPIEKGGALHLTPGGNHFMFIGLQKKIAAGDEVVMTLEFEKAGKIKQVFKVANLATNSQEGDDMKHQETH